MIAVNCVTTGLASYSNGVMVLVRSSLTLNQMADLVAELEALP